MVPNQANTTLTVMIEDSDDLPPRFTEGVYRTKINEFYPITVSTTYSSVRFVFNLSNNSQRRVPKFTRPSTSSRPFMPTTRTR